MNTQKLADLASKISACTRCGLYKHATNAVPGTGNMSAEVVFIGEAPGFHEDQKGEPFVGPAGKYLDLLLRKVGLRREDVFITNVVKHRPPENRDPLPAEVAACSVWLDAQLETISPKVIVTLGKWSLGRYRQNNKISEIHGKPFKAQSFVILPMYHPAAALRNSNLAKVMEEDFLRNKDILQNPQRANQVVGPGEGQASLF